MRHLDDRLPSAEPEMAIAGVVRWSPVKSLWFISMALGWLIGGSVFFSWGAVIAFIVISAIVLCGGHSIGMHRKLIHDSFDCPLWLERLGTWLGTVTGLGGPFTMMSTHDIRDWAQRQSQCHSFLRHGENPWKDFLWQIHCKLYFEQSPAFIFPDKLTRDPFMIFIQRTSMAQQLIPAVILFALGGWGCVFWGVCGRITVSIFGHWLIGWLAHNHGHQTHIVKGAAAQGYDVKFCGLITFGECWHNNHHAFPESARLGLYRGQIDPGWWVLRAFEKIGWVRNLKTPENLPIRQSLIPLKTSASA